ncbi:glycosyltransferase family 2 protein [Sneathiella sp.]|uniref:glycosyltransferase family 2 protein n=1 Tax=Sneathiella sp. TaxID=1964365 RepID=UPI002FE40D7D
MRNDNETISVIIPAYKSANTICATVDSVLNQTRRPDEIIIVDDCSPDDTVAALGPRMEQVIFIRHERNKGVSSARNTGFNASTGSLVAFLDGDDLYFPEFMERASGVLAETPEAALCFGNFHRAFEEQFALVEDRSIPNPPHVRLYRPEEILKAYLYDSSTPLINFGLVRRTAIEQILKDGLVFDPRVRLTGDFNYMLELLLNFTLAYIDDRCGIWRLRAHSMSEDRVALWQSRAESIDYVLAAPALANISARSRAVLEDAERAAIRYCAKILATSGERREAVKVLMREFMAHPSIKTLGLLSVIALGLAYRQEIRSERDWRGSTVC